MPKVWGIKYKVKGDDEIDSDESTTKGPPVKVLWYIQIIPRFKHFFANANDAKDLTWLVDERIAMKCFIIKLIPPNGRKLIV